MEAQFALAGFTTDPTRFTPTNIGLDEETIERRHVGRRMLRPAKGAAHTPTVSEEARLKHLLNKLGDDAPAHRKFGVQVIKCTIGYNFNTMKN